MEITLKGISTTSLGYYNPQRFVSTCRHASGVSEFTHEGNCLHVVCLIVFIVLILHALSLFDMKVDGFKSHSCILITAELAFLKNGLGYLHNMLETEMLNK